MFEDELIVDSFAGGGGASLGIAWALGRAHVAAAIVRANCLVGVPTL